MIGKKKYINKKTGQITDQPNVNLGTTEEYKPSISHKYINEKEVSPEEFKKFTEEQKAEHRIVEVLGGRKALTPEEITQIQRKQSGALPEAQQIPQVSEALPPETAQGKISEKTFGETLTATAGAELLFKKIRRGETLTPEENAQVEALGLLPRDIETIKSGDIALGGLSRMIEGIPILRKLKTRGALSFSIADFTGTSPGTNIDMLLKSLRENAGYLEDYKNQGLFTKANETKNKILELESKIKILSIISPEIQGDPLKADNIMTEIENIKINNRELDWYS